MFNDIMSFRSQTEFQERSLDEQSLFRSFDQPLCNYQLPQQFEGFLDSPFQNSQKQTTQDQKSFLPIVEAETKQKKKRIRKYTSNNPKNKKGHWTNDQNLAYHHFLQLHATYFLDRQRRKVDKIFKIMSSFIQTREAHQCRSHHQKIEKKWGSFPKILLNLRMENFRTTDDKALLISLQKKGFNSQQVFSRKELQNEEELYRKVASMPTHFEQILNNEQKTQQYDELSINKDISSSEQILKSELCLMMGEEYENQLSI